MTIPAETSGWDGGKKVSGRKRHLVVDCLRLLLAVAVTAAGVQDRDAAVPLLEQLRKRHFSVRLVWADGGYAGRLVDGAGREPAAHLDIVKRSDDTTGFQFVGVSRSSRSSPRPSRSRPLSRIRSPSRTPARPRSRAQISARRLW
ncbi:transposase [Streptomyces spinoverrucosus]|nr:transposase [Streptomyces spinoverrucosus]